MRSSWWEEALGCLSLLWLIGLGIVGMAMSW